MPNELSWNAPIEGWDVIGPWVCPYFVDLGGP